MPVYRKGEKWRVRVWVKGVRQDWIVEGSKAEALQFEAVKRVEMRALEPSLAGRNAPKFSDFCAGAYKTHSQHHLKKQTHNNRTYNLATLILFLGDAKLSDISTGLIEKYKAERLAEKIRPSSINNELKALRAVLKYARELGVPCSIPTIKDIPERGTKKRIVFWTKREVDRLMASVREHQPQLEGLAMFLLNTGCRKGEALALEWKNVDLRNKLVRIEPSDEWQPKDDRPREIPIGRALLPYLSGPHSSRWVFPSSTGERFAYWPQRYFDDARDRAKLNGGPHTCRHTFASHFLKKRPDIYLLGRILGHSNSYVTELYAHLLPDHLAMARDAVCLGTVPATVPKKSAKRRKSS